VTQTAVDGFLALGAALGPVTVRLAHPHRGPLSTSGIPAAWGMLVGESISAAFSMVVVWHFAQYTGHATPELVEAVTRTWMIVLGAGWGLGGVCAVLVQLLVIRFRDKAMRVIKTVLPSPDDTPVPSRRWIDDPEKPQRRWDDFIP
jgi:hypothetical protein